MRIRDYLRALARAPIALHEMSARAEDLHERMEFVRRELFFEIKYGRKGTVRESAFAGPRLMDAAKVEAARIGGLRLNVGCGHVPLEGYVNVDMREVPGVDVVATVDDLPFADGEIVEISSTHVLEHFPQEMLRRAILPHWLDKLAPGGTVKATVPDADAMIRELSAGRYPFADFREVFFGAQDYEGDFHFNMFTPESIGELLREAGFVDVRTPVRGRRNGRCFEFRVEATRP